MLVCLKLIPLPKKINGFLIFLKSIQRYGLEFALKKICLFIICFDIFSGLRVG